MWHATHFRRGRRWHCLAIVDVVSRLWIDYLLTPGLTTTQVQVAFSHALETEGLLELVTPNVSISPSTTHAARSSSPGPTTAPR